MNLFVLVALLCTDDTIGASQCDHYAIDSSLSSYDCDLYFTDSGVNMVDKIISDLVAYEIKEPLALESLECVQEDTE